MMTCSGTITNYGNPFAGQFEAEVGYAAHHASHSVEVPRVRVVDDGSGAFELVGSTTKGEVVAVTEMEVIDANLILWGLHIDGPGSMSVGVRELMRLGRDLGRQYGVKQVVVIGGKRMTGANPGHLPRTIVIHVNG